MNEVDMLFHKISQEADKVFNHFNALTGNEVLRNRLIDLMTIELRLRADKNDESSLQFKEKLTTIIVEVLKQPQPEAKPSLYIPK